MDQPVHRAITLRRIVLWAGVGIAAAWLCLSPRPQATLALLGDINLARGNVSAPGDGAFQALRADLKDVDWILANLESPLGTGEPEQGEYILCAPPEKVAVLQQAGIGLVSLANNHRGDCGSRDQTAKTLTRAGITSLEEDAAILRLQGGLPLVVLAGNDVDHPADLAKLGEAVSRWKKEGYIVVVSMHWGNEYQAGPSRRQEDMALALHRAGADLVWGHHPHVLQRVERLENADGKVTWVAYSLGNAFFDQEMLPDAQRSAVLLVTFSSRGVEEVRAVPFVIDSRQGRVEAADEETGRLVLDRLKLGETGR